MPENRSPALVDPIPFLGGGWRGMISCQQDDRNAALMCIPRRKRRGFMVCKAEQRAF